ncbi:MAG: aminotransferase class V-fold PLP-dependent enzyme [Candidatus Aminicenantes bacterium]|nr:aminotransferase class V-fold PLP-dependent enzyme [Candidatus Aminicenantes bacterium]
MQNLEHYFEPFRKNIVGIDAEYQSPNGTQKIVYADWIASGRLYGPIEDKIKKDFGPFVANTHTETSESGTRMTYAYQHAHKLIKRHVNASETDILITAESGMTGVINKLQRILNYKLCGQNMNKCSIAETDRPVVFVTHMEHHSNHTSWLETIADVVIVKPGNGLLVDPENLRKQLKEYKNRKHKIGSFTACSNVSGIETPYHKMAKIMHEAGGLCFLDFAASAPYVDMDMHPEDPMEKLDAIFFSPHKFLGGPGSSGVLVMDSVIHNREVPDHPGGGTVDWTNPWGLYKYVDSIEAREDGGTPGFLQAIRAALAIELKEKMGTVNIRKREEELVEIAFQELRRIPELHILADNAEERLGCISFYIDDIHYNLIVKLLSDRFGIQVRGGCTCAGTYGHYLLNVDREQSKRITDLINRGDLSLKPGWVRLSLHPTMTNAELYFVMDAIKQIAANVGQWEKEYTYSSKVNEFYHKTFPVEKEELLAEWFRL